MTRALRLAAGLGAALTVAVSGQAANLTWTASGGSWSDPANWTPGGVPGAATDTVRFSGTGGGVSTNDLAGLRLSAVTVQMGSNAFDLAANTLTAGVLQVLGVGPLTNASASLAGSGAVTVTNALEVGTGAHCVARLALAPGVALQVGMATNARARMMVGYNTGAYGSSTSNRSYFASGQVFGGFLSDLAVALQINGYVSGYTVSECDLMAATNPGVMDISNSLYLARGTFAWGSLRIPDSINMRIGSPTARGGSIMIAVADNVAVAGDTWLSLGAGRLDAYLIDFRLGEGRSAYGNFDAGRCSGGNLDIARDLVLGRAAGPYCAGGYVTVGDALSVRVGRANGDRGGIVIGSMASTRTNCVLVLGTGLFEAYVTNFLVGSKGGDYSVNQSTFNAGRVSSGVLDVSRRFEMAVNRNVGMSGVTLSPGFTTTIGTPTGRVAMLMAFGLWPGSARLTAGGSFTAHLSSLTVCSNAASSENLTEADPAATLDLSGVTNGLLDVDGPVMVGQGIRAAGTVRLTSMRASASTLRVGSSAGKGSTLLLTNTVFAVSGSAALDGLSAAYKGRVLSTVTGTPSGLDLGPAATLAVGQGLISNTFQNPVGYRPVYWGLRWAGDHYSALTNLQMTGKLGWDDSALTSPAVDGRVTIFLEDGVTYVGVHMRPPTGILVEVR